MTRKEQVKQIIDKNIYPNGQENITGQGLNATLKAIADLMPTDDIVNIIPLSPTDPTPTVSGWYKPSVSGIYPNAGNLEAKAGFQTLFYLDEAGAWKKSEEEMPKGQPLDYYPFAAEPLSEDVRNVAVAVEELYITDYDSTKNYVLRVLHKRQSHEATGMPENYSEITVNSVSNGTIVKAYSIIDYSDEKTTGRQLWKLNDGYDNFAYILIDWDKLPDRWTMVKTADNPEIILSENIGELDLNWEIKQRINPPSVSEATIQAIVSNSLSNYQTATQIAAQYLPKNESLSTSQLDSRYQLKGSITTAQYKVVDAADFGFLPNKTASENVAALQAALDGGNKTVTVSQPGIYKLNATVYLDDNTELIFGSGTLAQKAADYTVMLINRGAPSRVTNKNIIISGLNFSVNGFDSSIQPTSNITGINAQVAFLCVENLKINNITCTDLGHQIFALQISNFKNIEINGIHIEGWKDGLHLGPGKTAWVRNGKFKTYDDSCALNAFDYAISNPDVGDIEDIHFENITDLYDPQWGSTSLFTRHLVGTVGKWSSGIKVRNGDAFIHNGNLYRVFTNFSGNDFTSTTAPTITTYEGVQSTSEGITWKFIRGGITGDYVTANIKNVTYRNITHEAPSGRFYSIENDEGGVESRTVHPNIPQAMYPRVEGVKFDNFATQSGYATTMAKIVFDVKFVDMPARKDTQLWKQYADAPAGSVVNFTRCDFRGMSSPFEIRGNVRATFTDCEMPQYGIWAQVFSSPRLISNCRVNIDGSISGEKGDSYYNATGTLLINDGVNGWKAIN